MRLRAMQVFVWLLIGKRGSPSLVALILPPWPLLRTLLPPTPDPEHHSRVNAQTTCSTSQTPKHRPSKSVPHIFPYHLVLIIPRSNPTQRRPPKSSSSAQESPVPHSPTASPTPADASSSSNETSPRPIGSSGNYFNPVESPRWKSWGWRSVWKELMRRLWRGIVL